jgi:hypothetical protein
VNVEKYLQNVRLELIKFGPTLRLKVTEKHRKKMIRTLFGMPAKVYFDNAYRDACNSIQNKRMVQFIQDDLRPNIEHKETTSIMSILADTAPHLYVGMERALSLATLETAGTADKKWSYMARGRVYRGNFGDLLRDLAPELRSKYEYARLPPTDSDVFRHLLLDDSSSGAAVANNMDTARRKAVERCIEVELEAPVASTSIQKHGDHRKRGIECHQACVEYLKERHQQTDVAFILENVLVKSAQANRRAKAVPIITCSVSKDIEEICGEFDALVLVDSCCMDGTSQSQLRVAEIWEAKATISPTTLHGVITKKIPAIRSLLADESSLLWYSQDQTVPLCDNDSSGQQQLLLGVFGVQVLPPEDAASVLKAVTCIKALSHDVAVIEQALDTGFVEVHVDGALKRLDRIVRGVEDLVVVLREQDV